MLERADYMYSYVQRYSNYPLDFILVDNGSDQVPPAYFTTFRLPANVQTCRGWLAGLKFADILEESYGEPYFAYVIAITSATLVGGEDHVGEMVRFLLEHEDAVGIMPALTEDSDIEVWKQMNARGGSTPRQTWGLDMIFTMWRADWFNSIGRLDRNLIYAWGTSEETSWKARKADRSLWIHEGLRVKKEQDIGYRMDRMGMPVEERRRLGMENVCEVMNEKYGTDWMERLTNEYVRPEWK